MTKGYAVCAPLILGNGKQSSTIEEIQKLMDCKFTGFSDQRDACQHYCSSSIGITVCFIKYSFNKMLRSGNKIQKQLTDLMLIRFVFPEPRLQ